jgi:hypothetical protein
MEEQPKAPSARDMSGNRYTGKELVKVSGEPPPMTLASAGIDKNIPLVLLPEGRKARGVSFSWAPVPLGTRPPAGTLCVKGEAVLACVARPQQPSLMVFGHGPIGLCCVRAWWGDLRPEQSGDLLWPLLALRGGPCPIGQRSPF